MTYQPPPAGGTPPPPPPGGYGAPGSGPNRSSFDPKTVNPLDWGILACGFLAFIFSFVSYYKYSVSSGAFSASGTISAWHGFFGWFAALLALAGAAVIAVELFAPTVRLPVAARLAALGLFAVATLCVILAIFVVPGNTGGASALGYKIDKGHGFGFWISLILIIAGTVLALMRAQQTGTQLPGRLSELPNIGARGPQGGLGGSTPPSPGYAPPQSSGYAPPPTPGTQPPAQGTPPPAPGYGTPPPQQQPPQGFGQPPQ